MPGTVLSAFRSVLLSTWRFLTAFCFCRGLWSCSGKPEANSGEEGTRLSSAPCNYQYWPESYEPYIHMARGKQSHPSSFQGSVTSTTGKRSSWVITRYGCRYCSQREKETSLKSLFVTKGPELLLISFFPLDELLLTAVAPLLLSLA